LQNLSTDLGCNDYYENDEGDDSPACWDPETCQCLNGCDFIGMMKVTYIDGSINTKMLKSGSPAMAALCGIFGTAFIALTAYAFWLKTKTKAAINIE